jgi:hypothetical protein
MLLSILSGTAVQLMVALVTVLSCEALQQQSPTTSTRRQHFGDVLVGSLATAVVATTAAPSVAIAEGGAKVSTQYPKHLTSELVLLNNIDSNNVPMYPRHC